MEILSLAAYPASAMIVSYRLLTAKLLSHSRAVEAAINFLKAACSLLESSYSREPFLPSSRHFHLDETLK
jgi:hypothetical protein